MQAISQCAGHFVISFALSAVTMRDCEAFHSLMKAAEGENLLDGQKKSCERFPV
jgi:hypothetical protein